MKKTQSLYLLDNIQFIYELALARLELQAFAPQAKVTDNFRRFAVAHGDGVLTETLKTRLAYFKTVNGETTDYYHLQKFNRTKSANQFITHWIYPYKGKFHPQMIRALLNITQVKSGETILDPFVGSGTAVLEAQLLGINGIGVDISPLCALVSRVKTESVGAAAQIRKHQDAYLFHLKKDNAPAAGSRQVKNFYKVAEMMAHSDQSRRGKKFETAYVNDAVKMLHSVEDYKAAQKQFNLKLGKTKIIHGDARRLRLADTSIDGIITSPPYSVAINYVANDAHALSALGHNLDKIKENFIGVRGVGGKKFELYEADMRAAYSEMYRVLKKGKFCVIIIGNVTYQKREIDTARQVVEYCERIGFTTVKKIEKIIYGLYNIMQKEYIIIFKKLL